MTGSRGATTVLVLCLVGCSGSAGETTSPQRGAAELASEACGHRTDQGGPPALVPLGARWQPTVGSYDATRRFAHRNAELAGWAAARDASWAPLALALRDLADIYETARAEYAAVLAGHATASERTNLRALQDAATTALSTITQACRRAP